MPYSKKIRPVGDFFGPFFTLEFKSPLQLPTLSDTSAQGLVAFAAEAQKAVADNHFVSAKLDSIQLRNFAARLSVETTNGSPLTFTITMTPPYDTALEILDNKLLRYGTVVQVQWGYLSNGSGTDIMTSTYVFVINQAPKVVFGKEITITITGYDPVSSSLMGRERKVLYDRKQYSTDESLIIATLKDLNYVPNFENVSPQTLAALRTPKDPEREPANIQRDLWTFLREICDSNNITFFILEENNVLFHDLSKLAVTPEAYRLLWYTQPQNNRDIPMISFSAESLPSFFAAPSRTLLNLSYDMDQGAIIRSEIDPAEIRDLIRTEPTNQIPSADNSTSGKVVKLNDQTSITPSPRFVNGQDFGDSVTQPNMLDNRDGRAKRLMLEAVFAANNKATVVAPGHPDVIPPMNVFVEGVGKAFSGTYQVVKAKHEIGTSGYDMTLELRRLASPPELMDGATVPAPIAPSSQPTSSAMPPPKSPDQTGS